jgi:hypothetical protein
MVRRIEGTVEEKLQGYSYRMSQTSYLGLRPGDLIQFRYSGSSKYGLVVSSKRTSDGMFLSTRNNTLLNVVVLPGLSESMFSLVVNNLYENESACNYYSPKIIGAFLGKQNFRTFNVSKIRGIIKVQIIR